MGFLKQLHRGQKNQSKEAQESAEKELQDRARQFMNEYKAIKARYRCDFEAQMGLLDGGKAGIVPVLKIIDITKTIEEEKRIEEEKEKRSKLEQVNNSGNED